MPRFLSEFFLICGAALLIGACAPRALPEVRLEQRLDEPEILKALFRSAKVPISIDPFCAGIAAPETQTIGRFVAGLLAAQERHRRNWLEIGTSGQNLPSWSIDVLFVSFVGREDDFTWGMRFQVVPRDDRLIDPASFRCFTGWYP